MSALRVLIVGGGVAALEAMLALRRLAEERVAITVIAPEKSFAYRPLAVAEPFGLGAERRFDLAELAADAGAELLNDRIATVDASAKTVRTASGASLHYDALVIACGARRVAPIPEAITFWGPEGHAQMTELVEDLEGGWVKSVAFVVPRGCGWPLPLYELALLTSSHLVADGARGVELMVVTPEAAPLEVFGAEPSEQIRRLLAQRGIGLFTGSSVTGFRPGELSLSPAGELHVERVVALPRLEGPRIDGLPTGPQGFVPVDLQGNVPGLDGVYAAGDATTVPIKQGGLAAQLADVIAAEIAMSSGAPVEPEHFQPVLRGMLLTGDTPRYLRADFAEGGGEISTVADHALWWPPSKIAGRYLAPHLATLATSELPPNPPSGRHSVAVTVEIDASDIADGH